MSKPLVVILMGSKADVEHCTKISDACKGYGLETVMRIASAHKTPEHALTILREYEADERPKVYITVAGRSNALSGFTDGSVSAPVIACPPPSDSFGGADVFSSLRMPSGIAVAVALEPVNAALLAAKIFGVANVEVREQVKASQKRAAEKIIEDDKSVK
ncbi:MAG: 5-(carboxyamino)imidazole ribonucleotide mutase [Anaerolineales bacterium]|nr:5-(carboxyamino)imidazole ribonucleotide mutase [Anaerolineales bacterium]